MRKRSIIAWALFAAYGLLLLDWMVFRNIPVIHLGHLTFRFGGADSGPANFVPFKTILLYLIGRRGFVASFFNLAGNIGLLVPWGFLANFAFGKMAWRSSLALSVATGLAIETLQALLHTGIFDVDDVILNGLGVMIGYWACIFVASWARSRTEDR